MELLLWYIDIASGTYYINLLFLVYAFFAYDLANKIVYGYKFFLFCIFTYHGLLFFNFLGYRTTVSLIDVTSVHLVWLKFQIRFTTDYWNDF